MKYNLITLDFQNLTSLAVPRVGEAQSVEELLDNVGWIMKWYSYFEEQFTILEHNSFDSGISLIGGENMHYILHKHCLQLQKIGKNVSQ